MTRLTNIQKIPEGFIEEAERYVLIPNDRHTGIELGGKVMMNLVVREQMTMTNIVMTTGVENKGCIILVDYSYRQVIEKIEHAKKEIEKYGDFQAKNELED